MEPVLEAAAGRLGGRIEPDAAIAHVDHHLGSGDLRIDVDLGGVGVFGRIEQRFACGGDQRGMLVGQERIAAYDRIDFDVYPTSIPPARRSVWCRRTTAMRSNVTLHDT